MEQTLKEMLYDLQIFKVPAIYFSKLAGNGLGRKEWSIVFMQTAGGEQFAIYRLDFIERQTAGFYTPDIEEALRYANKVAAKTLQETRDFDFDWRIETWEERKPPFYETIQNRGLNVRG